MKIRTDFVTNSSSSSFVLARTPELSEQQKEAILDYVTKKFLGKPLLSPADTEEKIQDVFENNWMLNGGEYQQEAIRKALSEGLCVYAGQVVFDGAEDSLADTYEAIWKIMAQNDGPGNEFVTIDDDLGY